jgi:peptide/nickel transport system permease protein
MTDLPDIAGAAPDPGMHEPNRIWLRFRNHLPGQIGAGFIVFLMVVALAAPLLAPQGFDAQDLTRIRQPPSLEHVFGTDRYGRDVFDRVIWGTRIALKVALLVVTIQFVVGVTLGLISGYFGRWIDALISGLIDLVWAFPPLILALGIIAAVGPGLLNVIFAIAITSWAPFARLTRAKAMSLRSRDYVEAGIAIGESHFTVLSRYILPGVLAPNLVLATLTVPAAILTTSALSFLGLGAQPPSPDWGAILNEGREFLRDSWWISAFPGLAILLTALSFNFVGDALRDAFDPRQAV